VRTDRKGDGLDTLLAMAHPDSVDERIAALEAAVRELSDRLDNPGPYVAAAQAEWLARIVDRYPDLLEDRRTLG
jgi:hypothetical protein